MKGPCSSLHYCREPSDAIVKFDENLSDFFIGILDHPVCCKHQHKELHQPCVVQTLPITKKYCNSTLIHMPGTESRKY